MRDLSKLKEGRPCRKCGGTLRWKSNRHCVECSREDYRRYHQAYREREWARQRRYRAENPEKGREYDRRRRKRLKAEGRCITCGEPSLSEAYCWACLSKKQDHYLGG